MEIKLNLFLLLLIISTNCFPQGSFEREHRIKKSQFPALKDPQLIDGRGLRQFRYYKETDNSQSEYRLRFKRDRLNYYMSFSIDGELLNLGFGVKTVDIPSDTYAKIIAYLGRHFEPSKIRRMYQEYQVKEAINSKEIVKNAFQNMLHPDNKYKILLRGKKEGKWNTYEAYFRADGEFVKIRQALPPDYDHILY